MIETSDSINGKTYQDLLVEHTKWVWASPVTQNPGFDYSGSIHKHNQPLPDFTMLAGRSGPNVSAAQNFTVSRSKPIFVPIVFYTECFFEEDKCNPNFKPSPGQSTEDFLKGIVNPAIKGMVINSFLVNGKSIVSDFSKYVTITKVFRSKIRPVNNNACNNLDQEAYVLSGGYAILLKLSAGNHTIYYKGGAPAENFTTEQTFNLKVE